MDTFIHEGSKLLSYSPPTAIITVIILFVSIQLYPFRLCLIHSLWLPSYEHSTMSEANNYGKIIRGIAYTFEKVCIFRGKMNVESAIKLLPVNNLDLGHQLLCLKFNDHFWYDMCLSISCSISCVCGNSLDTLCKMEFILWTITYTTIHFLEIHLK